MTRRLMRSVSVGGKHYPAGTEVPDDVAERITNPRAWGESAGAEGQAPAGEHEAGAAPPVRPKDSASKADWVDYAESQGMDRGEAEAMTRDELAEHYPKG